jgi:hypothetical protein
MTLLIRRWALVLILLLSIVVALVPAAVGYGLLRNAVDLSSAEAKVGAERLLFVAIVAASGLVATLIVALLNVFHMSTALARIADLHRVGGYAVEPALARLGDVGESITQMYAQLTEISERKSTRIAAMNALLNVILARNSVRLLVVDPRGEVFRATPAALKHLNMAVAEVLGEPVDTVIPDVEFSRIRAAIGRTGEPWAAEESSASVSVQPVLNDRGEVGYYVFYLGSDARLVVRSDPSRDQPVEITPAEPDVPQAPRQGRKSGDVVSRLRRYLSGDSSRKG